MSKERVILGKDCIYSSDPSVTGINKNVAIVGGTGTGKTSSFLEPELMETLRATEPVNRVVILTKRRIADKYIPLFRKAGFHVYDLNFADPTSGNCMYDPLAYVRCDDDIKDVSHAFVTVNERKARSTADPFWDEAAEALLGAEMGAVMMNQDDPTFADVLELHSRLKIEESGSGIKTTLDPLFERIQRADPEGDTIRHWKTFSEAAPKTAKSIFVSMNPTLEAFTSDVRHCIRTKPSIDFEKVAHEKSIIFITTSPVKMALHSMANIFVSQAIAELSDIAGMEPFGTLPIPVHFSFDDFATGARVAKMPEKLSICREKGISFSLLIQSESQLERMYDHYGKVEILDNCDSYIFMGGNNLDTARSISVRLNVPLEDVLYMPVGQVFVFRRGQKPVITSRYDIYNDEFYKKITAKYERSQRFKYR